MKISRSKLTSIIREVSSTSCGEKYSSKKAFKKNINEISLRKYNSLIQANPRQKTKNAFSLLKRKLNEIDKIVELSIKLREEIGNDWKLNEKQLQHIKEKTQSLSKKLNNITKIKK